VKVTDVFASGLPPESVTVTDNAVAKAVFTVADCGVVFALATTELAAPAVLVSENVVEPVPAAAATL
jgi:hypothetical protein